MTATVAVAKAEPRPDCPLCPRLAGYRIANQAAFPGWFNAPVPSFGDPDAVLLIVGLAPGLRGANRTGRPFTGDYAGELLYRTLIDFGFAEGQYAADPADGLRLKRALIANAVRCAPPENKPTPAEINTCRIFLSAQITTLTQLRAALTLGKIAHDSLMRALREPLSKRVFRHGAMHKVNGLMVFNSYHCSRYNTNTGTLTQAMFREVFAAVRSHLNGLDRNQSSTASE